VLESVRRPLSFNTGRGRWTHTEIVHRRQLRCQKRSPSSFGEK